MNTSRLRNSILSIAVFAIATCIPTFGQAQGQNSENLAFKPSFDIQLFVLIASAEGDFLVLDPNNENQVSTPAVDYGKLYQSLHSGYEFLIQLERCDVTQKSVNFEEAKSFFGLGQEDRLMGFVQIGIPKGESVTGKRRPIEEKIKWITG